MIYQPAEDSYLLEKEVLRMAKNKKVLDVGTGSGIQAEAALKAGAKEVVAIDIDEESLKFCRKKKLKVLKSDLFEKVRGKFDLIIFNPPYLPEDEREDYESSKATSGGEAGDEIILRFLKEAGNNLEEYGKILIVVSSLTPLEKILRTIKNLGMGKEVLASEKFFMEKLEVWEIRKT